MTGERLKGLFANRRTMQRHWYDPTGRAVNYPVVIRADRAANWSRVALALQTMAEHGGVFRVRFAAKRDGGEEGEIQFPLPKQTDKACPADQNDSKTTLVSIRPNDWTLETRAMCSRCERDHSVKD